MSEGASVLAIRRDREGRTWISVDSLIDALAEMGDSLGDGPAKDALTKLARTFRPASSYAAIDEHITRDDGSKMRARNCASCGTAVIDGHNIAGATLTVDAAPVPHGELFPAYVIQGVPRLAPWRPGLDGLPSVRLTQHHCSPAGAS